MKSSDIWLAGTGVNVMCNQAGNYSAQGKACLAASPLGPIVKTAKERLHTCKRDRHAQTLSAVCHQDRVCTTTKRASLPLSRYEPSANLLTLCATDAQVALNSDADVQIWLMQCLGSFQHDVLHHTCSLKIQGLVEGRWQRHAARMTGSSRKAPFAFHRLLLLGQCRGHCQCHVAQHVDVGCGILQGGIFSVLQGAQDFLDHWQH